jgi:circadian clock protein KaiC
MAAHGGGSNGRLSTGIEGLDEVLDGGLIPRRAYMVRGEPGVGKTAVGLHFLAAGRAAGERTLFLTQGATIEAVQTDAQSIGIETEGMEFVDFTPEPELFSQSQSYDVFSPIEHERETYTARVVATIEQMRPERVFLDALTQGRHLSADVIDFRRQAHAFLRFLVSKGATVVFASGSSDQRSDEDLQFMSDGVLHLEYSPEAGGRVLTVTKMRGSRFRLGRHSIRIADDGLHVYPRLVPEQHGRSFVDEPIPSGIGELDALFGGGFERGTVTMITGPSGVGKTTLAMQFLRVSAERGERAVAYSFEESAVTMLQRSAATGRPLEALLGSGMLDLVEAEPLDYTPDQFALAVRREIEQRGTKLVLLDSLAGYRQAIRGEDLVQQVHALCRYLKNMGVTVIVVYENNSITGDFRATELGISYLADNIVFLRYVEVDGELRRVVGVLKKRMSDFEKAMRELTITADGLVVGEPLRGLRGILTGVPHPSSDGTLRSG